MPGSLRVEVDSYQQARQQLARILVVEDDPFSRQLLAQQLRRLGYTCKAVADGLAALQCLEQEDFDIILMDCQLPALDGLATARAIRQRESSSSRSTIIAVTANILPEDQHLCFAAGMDDYLSKPLRLETLNRVLKRWMYKRPRELQQFSVGDTHAKHGAGTAGMEESHSVILQARQALKSWDWSGLEHSANYLKLISKTLGLPQLGNLAQQLLTSALRRNCTIALVTIQQLEQILHHLEESPMMANVAVLTSPPSLTAEEDSTAAATSSVSSPPSPQFLRRSRKGVPLSLLELN